MPVPKAAFMVPRRAACTTKSTADMVSRVSVTATRVPERNTAHRSAQGNRAQATTTATAMGRKSVSKRGRAVYRMKQASSPMPQQEPMSVGQSMPKAKNGASAPGCTAPENPTTP